MKRSASRHIVNGLLALGAISACSSAARKPGGASPMSPAELSRATGGRPPYTRMDVSFMSGMIGHHAQAILMGKWAPSHGASRSIQVLCERIVVSQRDEIVFMQRWLRERKETVPPADTTFDPSHAQMMHDMPGMAMPALMPGMLTPGQLAQLDSATGREFDRLFLKFMIQHHEGAVTMVDALFGAGAGQDDAVFKFASDVYADQTTEIDRMSIMLAAMPPGSGLR